MENLVQVTTPVTMYVNLESGIHGKYKRRRTRHAKKSTGEADGILGENDVEPVRTSGFRCYEKHGSEHNGQNVCVKRKRHRYKGSISPSHKKMCTDSNIRCEGSGENPLNYQYDPSDIEAEPSTDSKLRAMRKCQSDIKDPMRKNKKQIGNVQIHLRNVAEEKNIRQSFKSRSIISRSSTVNVNSIDSHSPFSHLLQKPIFCETNGMEFKPICVRKRLRRKHYKLRSTYGITELVQSSSVSQPSYDKGMSHTERLSFPKPRKSPFAKTEFVYNVYGETFMSDRKPGVNLGSNTSFNIKFYKSMGDGRQMFGNGCPCPQLPRNYSPTNMARGGRDEDGCICVYIPQQQVFDSMQSRNATGDSFLKRYFRVLLKEQARCVCKRPKQRPYPYENGRFNPYGGGMPLGNVGCQCKYDFRNPVRSFRANDVAVQCKCKERRGLRSDDLFRRDRGTTCYPPTCPQNETGNNSRINDNVPNALNQSSGQGKRDKNGVNIGSNFSFQVGLYKRCIDTKPKDAANDPKSNGYYAYGPYDSYSPYTGSGGVGGDDCDCYGSDDYGYREPKSASIFSVLLHSRAPRVQCKSSSINNTERDNVSCSYVSSNQDRCIEGASPSCCMSRSPSSFLRRQFERSDLCCNNQPKSRCKPKKHKAVRCRCDKKPAMVGCTDKKDIGISSPTNLGNAAKDSCCDCYSSKGKNRGCNCSNDAEVVLRPCKKKKKLCCNTCSTQESKKGISVGTCCKAPKNDNKSRRKNGGCCCCDDKKKSSSLLDCLFKKDLDGAEDPCCGCSKEPKLNKLGEIFTWLFQRKDQNTAPDGNCSCNKSGDSSEFDYKKVLNNMKLKSQGGDNRRCVCGDINVKKVLSCLLEPTEQKLTKAQQCGCGKGDFDFRKTFGRLLLHNTVQKPICITCLSNDQNSRSVGAGEEDYRKLPPYNLNPDAPQAFMSKFMKPETCCTTMQYSAINPYNQAEAGIQHMGRIGPDDTAGAVVCRNQGSCVPKSKAMTLKECEDANLALQSDPNRRAVRIGSTCSFSLEIYKGMPPTKTSPTSYPPPTSAKPPLPPCADIPPVTATICPATLRAMQQRKETPDIKQTIKYMLRPPSIQSKQKETCKKCKSCVKVPAIKRGFATILLSNKQPLKAARTCQKTNTLQPNRRVVTRKPPAGGKGRLGGPTKCDPYVCLKRINERKCCR